MVNEAAGTPGQLRCVVVTPEREVFDAAATLVILPMFDGEFGVMSGRAPLIGRLGAGELRVTTGAGVNRYYIDSGFVQVRQNVITILTRKAVPAEKISVAESQTAAEEAAALPFSTPSERALKEKARERARGMKQVSAKH